MKAVFAFSVVGALAMFGCRSTSPESGVKDWGPQNGMRVNCEGAHLVQESAGTWRFVIQNNDAGNAAKGLITESANREAYAAWQAGDQRQRNYPWTEMSAAAPGEHIYYVTTAYGADILSWNDLASGRRMTAHYTNNLFHAGIQTLDNNSRLRFVLESKRKRFGQGQYSCAHAEGRFVSECVVQEYIFNNCRM